MRREGAKLSQSLDSYVSRLESYLGDYETARRQGFFVTDSHFHNRALALLKRKTRGVRELRSRMQRITNQIGSAGNNYDKIARIEMEKLEQQAPITVRNSVKVEKSAAQISYPNLSSEDWVEKTAQLLDWDISPIPQA